MWVSGLRVKHEGHMGIAQIEGKVLVGSSGGLRDLGCSDMNVIVSELQPLNPKSLLYALSTFEGICSIPSSLIPEFPDEESAGETETRRNNPNP